MTGEAQFYLQPKKNSPALSCPHDQTFSLVHNFSYKLIKKTYHWRLIWSPLCLPPGRHKKTAVIIRLHRNIPATAQVKHTDSSNPSCSCCLRWHHSIARLANDKVANRYLFLSMATFIFTSVQRPPGPGALHPHLLTGGPQPPGMHCSCWLK